MEKNRSGLLFAFLIGAAAGAVVTYLIQSGKGEEIAESLKETAGKLKSELDLQVDKGKDILNDLHHRAEEAMKA